MTVANLLRRLYGADSYEITNLETDTVNIAEQIVARANPARALIIFTNNSANTMYLHHTNQVGVNLGIRLLQGGTVSFNMSEDWHMSTLEWHASANVDASRITVTEVILR